MMEPYQFAFKQPLDEGVADSEQGSQIILPIIELVGCSLLLLPLVGELILEHYHSGCWLGFDLDSPAIRHFIAIPAIAVLICDDGFLLYGRIFFLVTGFIAAPCLNFFKFLYLI